MEYHYEVPAEIAGWMNGIGCAVTICDREGRILYMNDRSRETFASHGDLVGHNLMPCHNERSQQMIRHMLQTGETNAYTIEKAGQRKLIYQTPWRRDGEIAGMAELSIVLPPDMPHYVRKPALTLHKGRPADTAGREDREVRVYDLLDKLGVDYDRLDHAPAMTMEVCEEINAAFGRMTLAEFQAETGEERTRHAIVCKNLFLCNRQKTRFYLLLIPGDKKFLTKDLSAQINSARLSFAGEEEMLRYLDTKPGSVSVLGLMNDHEGAVQLLIDRAVLQSEFVGCHPCQNTSSLRMKTCDLMERVIPALHHTPILVTL